MKVPTRWSPSTPSPRSALASRAARRPASAYVRRLVPSPVQVTTSPSPNTDVPYRMIDVIVSGRSIIVLRTEPPPLGACPAYLIVPRVRRPVVDPAAREPVPHYR